MCERPSQFGRPIEHCRRRTQPTESKIPMESNILLVDDNPAMIRLMGRLLSGHGQLRCAMTGQAALELARDLPPDLMLLDAEMPGMSGYQVCEAIKADPELHNVPIIFVTSHTDVEFELKALELGAVDFIAKPI